MIDLDYFGDYFGDKHCSAAMVDLNIDNIYSAEYIILSMI